MPLSDHVILGEPEHLPLVEKGILLSREEFTGLEPWGGTFRLDLFYGRVGDSYRLPAGRPPAHPQPRGPRFLYSLVATCKAHGIDPWAYLRDVLERIPTHPNRRRAELLPAQWKAAQFAQPA